LVAQFYSIQLIFLNLTGFIIQFQQNSTVLGLGEESNTCLRRKLMFSPAFALKVWGI
jgi:hypothetical protein